MTHLASTGPRRATPAARAAGTRRLLALAAAAAALVLAACGGGDATSSSSAPSKSKPKVDPNAPVEDQLGFDSAGIMARQSRVEASIRDCMKAQGFDYVPVDPYRPARRRDRRQPPERRGVPPAVRLRHQHALGPRRPAGRPQRAHPAQPRSGRPRGLRPRAVGRERRARPSPAAVDSGDFTKLGGCTRRATEAVFGGAQVLTQLQGRLDQLDDRILEDQRMVRALEKWTACMAEAGYHYEDPDEIDGELDEAHGADRRAGRGPVRDRAARRRARAALRPRGADRAPARRGRDGARGLRLRAALHHARSSRSSARSTRRSSARATRASSARSSRSAEPDAVVGDGRRHRGQRQREGAARAVVALVPRRGPRGPRRSRGRSPARGRCRRGRGRGRGRRGRSGRRRGRARPAGCRARRRAR